MKHPSPSTGQPTSPGDCRRHRSGRFVGALIAAGLTLAAPSLHAQKGGGKGKPGGGEEPPPPPPAVTPVYSAEVIPTPSWADAHSPSSINFDGMVVGWATVEVARNTFESTHGFLWKGGGIGIERLFGLPGDYASWPQDLSDGGAVVVGMSTGADGRQPVAWVEQADGSYATLPLKDKMMAYAAAHLPEWPIETFEIGSLQLHGNESVLSAGGEFLIATATLTLGGWVKFTYTGAEIGVLVRWDWSNPEEPLITGMWITGVAPKPDQAGFKLNPGSIELGYKNFGSPDEAGVVWMAGSGEDLAYDPESPTGDWFQCRIEFDPATGDISFLNLDDQIPGGSVEWLDSINALGEITGSVNTADAYNVAYAWGVAGNLIALDLLPGATRNYTEGINAAGELVGTSGGACLWSIITGEGFDLNALTEGNLGLTRAHSINEDGQITAGWFGYKGSRFVSTNWYVLTRIVAP